MCVYARAVQTGVIISILLLVSGLAGFSMGNKINKDIVVNIKEAHLEELHRQQFKYEETIGYMTGRIHELVELQVGAAEEIAQASREARAAVQGIEILIDRTTTKLDAVP